MQIRYMLYVIDTTHEGEYKKGKTEVYYTCILYYIYPRKLLQKLVTTIFKLPMKI